MVISYTKNQYWSGKWDSIFKPSSCLWGLHYAGIRHWMAWQSAVSPTGKHNLLALGTLGQFTICLLELSVIMAAKAIAGDNTSKISTSCCGSYKVGNLDLRLCFSVAQIIAQ